MVTINVPGMKKRFSVAKHSGDFEMYADYNSDALDKESVPVIGKWTDNLLHGETTSGGIPTQQQIGQIMPNELQGTEAGYAGGELPNLNEVGRNANVFRRRKRVLCVDVPEYSRSVCPK